MALRMASLGLASADATAVGAPEAELLRCWHPTTAAEIARIIAIFDFIMTSHFTLPCCLWRTLRRQRPGSVLQVRKPIGPQLVVSWLEWLPLLRCRPPESGRACRARRQSFRGRRSEACRRRRSRQNHWEFPVF